MLYIHIPFCKGKCIYCDFYSAGNPDWQKYLKAIVSELDQRIGELRDDFLSSIYIGGGTPSLIPENEFGELIRNLKNSLEKVKIRLIKDIEFTIEVNPEDVTDSKALTWKENGVNRVSMGIQSLSEEELLTLKRRHTSARAIEAIKILKRYFDNISVDLIYGIPGQNDSSLRHTLQTILTYSPEHISAYSLTFESGTPLQLMKEQGKLKETDEEEYLRFYNIIRETLSKGGYEQYEISNYSKPGYHSRHNSGYWEGKSYLGIGPSAASYNGIDIRRTNPSNLKSYLEYFSLKNYEKPYFQEEHLNEEERREERIFISLRTKKGINLKDFFKAFGEKEYINLKEKAKPWIDNGMLKEEKDFLRLTQNGIFISDNIILQLI